MGIGVGIFLVAVGAILAFAVDYQLAELDIAVVGWILMIVGALGIVLALTVIGPRRRREDGALVEERRTYQDPPLR